MNFDKDYTNYWLSATSKSLDGLKIPGLEEARKMLPFLDIKKEDKILDLGCSYGRMYNELASFSDYVYGVDPDPYAVDQARKNNKYAIVQTGTAEDTGMPGDFFNEVFCWQVMDVVNHIKGLIEVNRILRIGGRVLITGKNYNYYPDDVYAFKAEKNAFLKEFPNHFTKLDVFMANSHILGFNIKKLLLFSRRGDFGKLEYNEVSNNQSEYLGYEYLLIGEKIGSVQDTTTSFDSLDRNISITAENIATEKGFPSAKELFTSIGID